MRFIKETIVRIVRRIQFVLNNKRAEMKMNDIFITKRDKITKHTFGKTTYLVSSFFKKTAKGNVVDKISRLIEREAENIASK